MRILVNEKLSNHKYKTSEGYLICTDAILARTGKQTYMSDELFNDGCSDEISVNRPYDEVMNTKTIASVENKPITFDHPDENVNVGNYKHYSVGYVRDVRQGKTDSGEDVIIGNLVITDQNAINAIENGDHTELSCGYDCDIVKTDNGYEQHNIRMNHVALCECGRAGNARIIDSKVKDDNIFDSIEDGWSGVRENGVIYNYHNGYYYITHNNGKVEKIDSSKFKNLEELYDYVDRINDSIKDTDRVLEIYRLCKENNWYTLGDTEDYEYMLDHCDIWSTSKIAINIGNHSRQSVEEIYKKLKTKIGDSNMKDSIKLNFKNFSQLDRYAPVDPLDMKTLYRHMVNNGLQQYYFVYDDEDRNLVERTKRVLSNKYFRSVNTIHGDFETPDGDKFSEAIVVVRNNNVKDSVKDISFRYLTESEKELKEALGLYKKIEGSHTKTSSNSKTTHRQNQFNNSQVAELNEAINEAIRNLNEGVRDKSAWQRLTIKLEAWENDPEYAVVARKAKNAIRRFTQYITRDASTLTIDKAISLVRLTQYITKDSIKLKDKVDVKALARELQQKFHTKFEGIQSENAIEAPDVYGNRQLDRQITQYLKSKGLKVMFDGIDDAGCYNIIDSIKLRDISLNNGDWFILNQTLHNTIQEVRVFRVENNRDPLFIRATMYGVKIDSSKGHKLSIMKCGIADIRKGDLSHATKFASGEEAMKWLKHRMIDPH